MNRKTQDSTDELLRALRASLDEEADVSPDIVFSDRTDGGKGGAQADEEMAAFESYMAALLDGVVSDDRTTPTPKTPKAKRAKRV